MKTKSWIAFAVGALVLVLLLLLWRGWDEAPTAAVPVPDSPARVATRAEERPPPAPAEPPVLSTTSVDPDEEFCRIAGVTGRMRIEICDELVLLHMDWLEQRGARAELLAAEGDKCRLFLPGLVLTEDEIRARVLPRMANVVAPEKAKEIWDHPTTRAYVARKLKFGALGADAWYDFQKTMVPDPTRRGAGNTLAVFSSIIRRVPAVGAPPYPGLEWETWNNAMFDSITAPHGIGWNAASKAPAGFFRPEPILGVASRPPLGKFGSIELTTGQAVLRNSHFDGSKEEFDLPDVAQPKGK